MAKKEINKTSKAAVANSIKEAVERLRDIEFKDKIKSSYYLSIETEMRITELYMKRLREGERARKSQLVDEAIELLYETEMGKKK